MPIVIKFYAWVESFVTSAVALRKYKRDREINYPLLVADNATKKMYRVAEIPTFMIVDKKGVIRSVIRRFNGKNTEVEIRNALMGL